MSRFLQYAGSRHIQRGMSDLIEQFGDPVWLVGTNVEYAIYLELGTSKMPAYSFMQPAIQTLKADPAGEVSNRIGIDINDLETSDEVVEAVALTLERIISEDHVSGENRPRVQTSNLLNSIKAVRVR